MKKKTEPRPVAAYDREGVCIGVYDSISDMARTLGKDKSGIYRQLKKKSGMYAYILSEEELEELEKCDLKK